MKRRILLIEDDEALVRVLRDSLVFEGFDVDVVTDGRDALRMAKQFLPDLILLDVMLPGANGFDLCSALRQVHRTRVIMLTARSQKADKLRGLNQGADDYVTKPFDLEELIARMRAVLRRDGPSVQRLVLGDVIVDFQKLEAWKNGRSVELTYREFEILRYLAERREAVIYREELLRDVWGYADVPYTRSVDHAIARLRKKIEPDNHHPQFIHTVHGDGYRLTPGGSPPGAGPGGPTRPRALE
jgi:DNA-binding response OmpR family regulator